MAGSPLYGLPLSGITAYHRRKRVTREGFIASKAALRMAGVIKAMSAGGWLEQVYLGNFP